jgi:hypothetical protein
MRHADCEGQLERRLDKGSSVYLVAGRSKDMYVIQGLSGMRLHRKWRVPRESVLYRTFEGNEPTTEIENLNWWTTSTGARLPDFQVSVETRKAGDVFQALITPENL